MEARAVAKHVRASALKARLVVDLVRGKPVGDALKLLRFAKQRVAIPVRKTLESAVANAENNHDMDADALVIKEIRVDKGPEMRRLNIRARGMADIMRRRTCHITVVVADESQRVN